MPEQFELNFEGETPEEEMKRLAKEYKEKVKVPVPFNLDRKAIIIAIENPEEERTRLRGIAKLEDTEELRRTYIR